VGALSHGADHDGGARTGEMETHVALQYPNGRVHDTTLDRDLLVGEKFELYGRTWTAVRTKSDRRVREIVRRMVCVSIEAAPRTE
jgi:hypothetical protein